ncbi:serine/threonine protein kinase, CMGC group [Zopfochytrium polystomum]|nr:serine/threonine protein kinase, CMGC group [Zopfochytrium polystomum]
MDVTYNALARTERAAQEEDDDADEEEEQEDAEDYEIGGYHPVEIGEQFKDGRYTVLKKLGWGHFSTVWLARDSKEQRETALKIMKSKDRYTETALDEVKLLEHARDANRRSPFRQFVVELYDSFVHRGPHGSHVVMAFEVLGPNLLTLIRRTKHRGVQLPLVKQVAKQLLMGLVYLHDDCQMIHTDLKPENVVMAKDYIPSPLSAHNDTHAQTSAPTSPNKRKQDFSDQDPSNQRTDKRAKHDLAAASTAGADPHHMNVATPPPSTAGSKERTTHPPYPPGGPYSEHAPSSNAARRRPPPSALTPGGGFFAMCIKIVDLGNACYVDKHFTEDIQTRQYRSPEAILGARYDTSADIWSVACILFELFTGDYLFDPRSGSRHSKDEDHVAQIIELLGHFPRHVSQSGRFWRDFFDRDGHLRHISRFKMWPLREVLMEKYAVPKQDAWDFADFLLPMLAIDRRERSSAREMLRHPFLRDVHVPGRARTARGTGGGTLRTAATTATVTTGSTNAATATTAATTTTAPTTGATTVTTTAAAATTDTTIAATATTTTATAANSNNRNINNINKPAARVLGGAG